MVQFIWVMKIHTKGNTLSMSSTNAYGASKLIFAAPEVDTSSKLQTSREFYILKRGEGIYWTLEDVHLTHTDQGAWANRGFNALL